MQEMNTVFYIIVLIISVIIHEIAHGYMALRFGDHTAEYEGRLTLNPLKHLDLYGSILLPLLLIITKAPFLIGWAKPVPYNPNNFKAEERRRGTFWVSIAGILANLSIALFFGILIRLNNILGLSSAFLGLASVIVLVNIVLAIFNLIPIPPLDGSKVLFSLLGYKAIKWERFFEKYSLYILLFFLVFVWDKVTPVILIIFKLFTGIAAF